MKQNMRQKNMQAYLFLSPFLVFITVLYILPAILTVIYQSGFRLYLEVQRHQ